MQRLALVGLLILLAACSLKSGQPSPEVIASLPGQGGGQVVDETPTRWFVELEGGALSDGVSLQSIQAQHTAFRQAAEAAGVRILFAYSELFNGFSVEVPANNRKMLYTLPGVEGVYPVGTFKLPPREPANPNLASALTQTGADIAQNDLGLTGRGIKVGIIDSGIDLEHPAFAGRIVDGYDFVGDDYDASNPARSTPVPDPNPDDCNGHGTHVAGIVGGKDSQITGVAPGVRFGAYKVFGCEGSTSDDVVLAALERAERAGMDVVNMSLGSPFGWTVLGKAVTKMVKRGTVVVASAGNNGNLGLFATGDPAATEGVISVASFDNISVNAQKAIVNATGNPLGYLVLGGAEAPPTSGTSAEVVWIGRACNADALLANPTGKVALIERGACTFNEKYQRAVAAGAVGVIIHNNVAGLFAGGGVAGVGGVFGISISREDGLALRALTAPTTLTWTPDTTLVANPTGNLISSFSSWGLSQDLELKPDLGAPGGLIRSAVPLEQGGYAILSGTSMSAPHVAGAVALLLEGNPAFWRHQRPSEVRKYLQNTAMPKPFALAPASGFPETSYRGGAGMIDIVAAVQNRVTVTPSVISFAAKAGPHTERLVLKNRSNVPLIYRPVHLPGPSAQGSIYAPSFTTAVAAVSFSHTQITVPARGEATLTVTITPPPGLPNRGLYGGYVLLEPVGAGIKMNVPYVGMQGGYQAIQILTPTSLGLPLLARPNAAGTGYDPLPTGGTFTLQGNDIPVILAHFEHGARVYELAILNAATGAPIHPKHSLADYAEYTIRNTSANGFFAIPWDGTRISKYKKEDVYGSNVRIPAEFQPVPNGQYRLQIRVLKPHGNERNPADWETWTSPTITLARP
ncbi:MAG: S8 family serine peptidase [Meiothermus sp.]|uniref:S8 family serine peptidase n=1 Tax=Meiothermus sp. TaxID=1955249 RepID=UPI0026248CA2|nr:S8 family serine peptidase [Meiothermus sp.]MCS7058767.1 S8 family serine peptidase [Meiothermus sp.]MDW8482242.1 S8 family serine peptidase [Meiothermus sp.]